MIKEKILNELNIQEKYTTEGFSSWTNAQIKSEIFNELRKFVYSSSFLDYVKKELEEYYSNTIFDYVNLELDFSDFKYTHSKKNTINLVIISILLETNELVKINFPIKIPYSIKKNKGIYSLNILVDSIEKEFLEQLTEDLNTDMKDLLKTKELIEEKVNNTINDYSRKISEKEYYKSIASLEKLKELTLELIKITKNYKNSTTRKKGIECLISKLDKKRKST